MATLSHALPSRCVQIWIILLSLGELADLIDVTCGLLVLGNCCKIQVIHLDGLPGLLLCKVIMVDKRGSCSLVCHNVPRYCNSSRVRAHVSRLRLSKIVLVHLQILLFLDDNFR